ncbi:MAG: type II secretion system protein [Verrucomicrobiae bacterium]|nr:type II secretion system protein [Verrucomicrobiae bacterium]
MLSLIDKARRQAIRLAPTSASFTLIELLVVVAIIGILAAILVPSFQSVKEQSNKAKCMNNVRQIGIAIENYREDHEGCYPIQQPTAFTIWKQTAYMNILGSNYLGGNFAVFKCPSNKNKDSIAPGVTDRTNTLGQIDYIMNGGIFGYNPEGPVAGGWERVITPTIATVFYDFPTPDDLDAIPGAIYPHPDRGFNCYFVDGHVAWLNHDQSISPLEGQPKWWKWGRVP